jgi:hypothetical protein
MRLTLITIGVLVVLAGCSGPLQATNDSDPINTSTPRESITLTNTPVDNASSVNANTSVVNETSTPTSEPTQTPRPTDSDSLSYSEEKRLGTDPGDADTDGDGLQDGKEVNKWETDPTDPDTDGDGLDDTKETFMDTSPTDADSDDDGLEDGREVELGTDPVKEDTDDDGVPDAEELEIGTDPTEADTDGDGLKDGEDPDPLTYNDGDGLSAEREEELGTDPKKADTDGDGLDDDKELEVGTDPTDPDTDRDALPDGAEYYGNESGVPLPNADPLHYDIYVQEVVTPNGKELPDDKKEWMAQQFSEFDVSNPDGESGVHLHWAETTTTEKSTNMRNFNGEDFVTNKTDPYIVVLQAEGRGERSGRADVGTGVVWTNSKSDSQTQAWVDGHEIIHLIQGDVNFRDGCIDSIHPCNSWLSYNTGESYLPQKLADKVNERGLWYDHEEGPW